MLIFLLPLISLFCDNPANQIARNVPVTQTLSLDDFKGLPPEIEGCSCYFSENKIKFKDNSYIFASNYDSLAIISVNKKLSRLKLKKTDAEPNTFRDYDHTEVYVNDIYTVTFHFKYRQSSGDETWIDEGTITIEAKSGQKLTIKFIGECGC